MRTLLRIAAVAAGLGLISPVASAQNPPARQLPGQKAPEVRRQTPPQPPVPQPQLTAEQRRMAYRPVVPTQFVAQPYGTPGYQYHPGYRSVLRQPRYSYNENNYGVRNPGGVGRYAEYYPPGDMFQNGGHDPTPRAGFDQNLPVGSIDQQAMATQVGTQKYSVMQQHLDNFSRPLGFYGFGGFGLGGPF